MAENNLSDTKWLIKFFFSPEKVKNRIEIDLGSNKPIEISFNTAIPRIVLTFRISNLSSLDIILDRMLISIWIQQPFAQGTILERHSLPKHSNKSDILFDIQLSLPQQEQIMKVARKPNSNVPINIYLTAYFESKIGIVEKKEKIDRWDIPVSGLPKQPTAIQTKV